MAIIGIWGDSIVYGEIDVSGSGWVKGDPHKNCKFVV